MPDMTARACDVPPDEASVGDLAAHDVALPIFDNPAAWQELSPQVQRALLYIAGNYARPITLRDLAALTRMSRFRILRAFRKELGMTPHAMLIHIRVLRATTLLARGESIAGVATDVGFVDQTHFGRHFKRIYSITPGRFRAGIGSAPPTLVRFTVGDMTG